MIERIVESAILNDFLRKKVIVLLGARQVGKTTLLESLRKKGQKVFSVNCDDMDDVLLIEEEDGVLRTYEFKWSGKSKAKQPLLFASTYPDSPFTVVSPEYYWEFVK